MRTYPITFRMYFFEVEIICLSSVLKFQFNSMITSLKILHKNILSYK